MIGMTSAPVISGKIWNTCSAYLVPCGIYQTYDFVVSESWNWCIKIHKISAVILNSVVSPSQHVNFVNNELMPAHTSQHSSHPSFSKNHTITAIFAVNCFFFVNEISHQTVKSTYNNHNVQLS